MAVYKVPQDVEAEDKLIGPFSFRQFIYLMIAVGGLASAYALFNVLAPLALLPLPFAIFFGVLAFPLRKDQPMEIYLAAIVSFLTKSRLRLWKPDGIETMIEVIAPPPDDRYSSKGYSQDEVQRRLSYLAGIVDSRGWSIRGGDTVNTSSMQPDLYNEAQSTYDQFDEQGAVSLQIDSLLAKTNDSRRQQIIDSMKKPPLPKPAPITNYSVFPQVGSEPPAISSLYTPMTASRSEDDNIQLSINPYPSMNQSVLRPISETPPQVQPPVQTAPIPEPVIEQPEAISQPEAKPSEDQPSPAIIDLAHNHDDLSIETLSREANRIKQKELSESEEVVISLR